MDNKLKVLNLYCGIGGNRKLWDDSLVNVTAVEINPEIAEVYKSNFPNDNIIISDAHEYLLLHYKEFDFIWSSPPCQSHSKMNKATRHDTIRYADMKLYKEILLLQHYFTGLWVVENVVPYYDVLISGKEVDRHIFWSNFHISSIKVSRPGNFLYATKKVLMEHIGIYFENNIYLDGNHCPAQILRNCVDPKLGLHVFNCAFKESQYLLEVFS